MLTRDTIENIRLTFSAVTLPKEHRTHEAHLIVAILYVKHYGNCDATCRLCAGIILPNHFHQTDNNSRKGYHETLTIFWTTVIDLYIKAFPHLNDWELVNHFFSTKLKDSRLPYLFYEKGKVLSES